MRGDLMVSAFGSGSNGPGSSPRRRQCVMFLDKTLKSQCLSPPKCIKNTEILQVASCFLKPEISANLMGHLACMQTLPYSRSLFTIRDLSYGSIGG